MQNEEETINRLAGLFEERITVEAPKANLLVITNHLDATHSLVAKTDAYQLSNNLVLNILAEALDWYTLDIDLLEEIQSKGQYNGRKGWLVELAEVSLTICLISNKDLVFIPEK